MNQCGFVPAGKSNTLPFQYYCRTILHKFLFLR